MRHMRRGVATLAVLVSMMTGALPVAAGGFATVRLDSPPGEVVVEVPWSFGFMVTQHDVTPTNNVKVHLDAQHRESGQSISAETHQDGAVGHFVAEVTFPRAGAWKWSITPEPFGPTSFETLTVLDAPGGSKAVAGQTDAAPQHPAHIHSGTCAGLGAIAFPLTSVGAESAGDGTPISTSGAIGMASAVPVTTSATTIDASLAEFTSEEHAINIHKSEQNIDTHVACGDIGGRLIDGDLVVGLQQLHNSGDVGIAVLHPDGERRTRVALFMIVVDEQTAQTASAGTGVTTEIAIVDGGEMWRFDPPQIEVPVGGTVTWTNQTSEPHTVTGGH